MCGDRACSLECPCVLLLRHLNRSNSVSYLEGRLIWGRLLGRLIRRANRKTATRSHLKTSQQPDVV
jgi:hypothetical protein